MSNSLTANNELSNSYLHCIFLFDLEDVFSTCNKYLLFQIKLVSFQVKFI